MIFKAKPQIVKVTKTFIDGDFIEETAKVLEPESNRLRRVVVIVFPFAGVWYMAMQMQRMF